MNLLPEIPRELRRIIAEYGTPATKEDVEVLRDLGVKDKDLITVLDADDPKRGELVLGLLLLPDKTINQKNFKLSRFLLLAYHYYPTIRYLYLELRDKNVNLDYDSLNSIRTLALENKDLELASDVNRYINQKHPGDDLLLLSSKFN